MTKEAIDDGFRAVAYSVGDELEKALARIRELEAENANLRAELARYRYIPHLAAAPPESPACTAGREEWPALEAAKKFMDEYGQPESADADAGRR